MADLTDLAAALRRLDGRSYRAYRDIEGDYDAGGFTLLVDRVQGDPFARPSQLRVRLSAGQAELPAWTTRSTDRRRAAADFLNRTLRRRLQEESSHVGSGRGGELTIQRPGQEVLERTSVMVGADGTVEARFLAGLPARGRRILGGAATALLAERLPRAVRRALPFSAQDADALRSHVETVEDAVALRAALADHGLVGFVADGARLPRRSGVDDRPLDAARTRPFMSPASLRVELPAPNAGRVAGMGVPAGVTLIVGGGYHGKSTLLRALERGVYDHVPGDGRERVVSVPEAVKVRAEDGRRVAGTDISAFIDHLPGGQDTRRFWSENASGSTSQAAAIAEALEVGARCLLLDEDTSATNFMIRDARMQALVPREAEPITPFIDRARALHREQGVSTVLVVGGSGDYFDVADTVIALREYEPADVTAEARAVAAAQPTGRRAEAAPWRPPQPRVPDPASVEARDRRGRVRLRGSLDRLGFGLEEVDLSAVEQLVEPGQVRALGQALAWASGRALDGRRTLPRALARVMDAVAREGLAVLDPRPVGDYAGFRIFELAACLSRLRSLTLSPVSRETADIPNKSR